MIKMTNGELVEIAMCEEMEQLSKATGSGKFSYEVSKMIRKLDEPLSDVNAAKKKLLEAVCARHEDTGEPIIVKGQYEIPDSLRSKLDEDYVELMETEIEIDWRPMQLKPEQIPDSISGLTIAKLHKILEINDI